MPGNDVDIAQRYMLDLLGRLRAAAAATDPQWESFCFFLAEVQPGYMTSAEELVTTTGSVRRWTRPALGECMDLGAAWVAELRESGRSPWHAFVLGSERASGTFDAFAVYPGPEAASWELTAASAAAVMSRAWERLEIHPKPTGSEG